MGILRNIFKRESSPPSDEHAVIVHFAYGSTDLTALFELGDRLERTLAATGAGEYDGNEVAVSGEDGYLYLYGADADVLFAAIRPDLEATAFMSGAEVRLRYGPPEDGVEESLFTLPDAGG